MSRKKNSPLNDILLFYIYLSEQNEVSIVYASLNHGETGTNSADSLVNLTFSGKEP